MKTNFEGWLRQNIGIGEVWAIDDVEFLEAPLGVDVRVSYRGPLHCPICGKECRRYDTRKRTWRDLDFADSPCRITAEFPRVECPDHGVHEVEVEWSGETSRLTRRFERLCAEYSRVMPVHLAADLLGVGDHTIWNIVRLYADRGMRDLDLSDMHRLCIDETSYRKGHRYVTWIINPDTGGIVFGTLGKDGSVLTEFRVWLIHHGGDPDNIKVACGDMSPAFIAGIEREFPDAVIVFDKFHVVKLATDTVDEVRRTSGLKGRDAKSLRFKLLRNRESLSPEEKGRIDRISDEYFHIGKAYVIKEMLRDFYTMTDPESARIFLYTIIDKCLDSSDGSIFDLGLAIDDHQEGIMAWHHHHISNGRAEGNNSVIQAIKRSARGFTDPELLISLVYLRNMRKNGIA